MFSTYKQAIRRYYLLKKASGELPIRLQQPAPSKIRDHLEHYLSTSFDPSKDGQVLEAFFGKQPDAATYAKMVRNTEIDDFRPVIYWLKGKTLNPEDKHVHLAAMLLDFERPYVFGKNYDTDKIEESGSVETDDQKRWDKVTKTDVIICEVGSQSDTKTDIDLPIAPADVEEDIKKGDVVLPGDKETQVKSEVKTNKAPEVNELPKPPEKAKTSNNKRSKGALTFLLILLAISIGFVLKDLIADPIGKQCMYWNNDRYVAVACDAKLAEGTEKIALDTFLLVHFRKITRPDTITERSIGKIWYLKHEKKFDYFTVKGEHPVHGRRLNRLSDRIYRNEIASERLQSASQ